ncbi:hypothetical protein [Shewanella violacea]|uniref:Uncharacterized protein n=1 Tax=Shewanella violacea (strain JCM 10179 / CIP 106290 / LMG 19151 / DSS12) TaxID=637905 RepID=D4ZD06_SHEVD|nr:hypothetical protein [Shewanella violacea]BAJ03901.1 hypothetical protein SVI_3930 [Shewanella violacea DSS12]
MTIFNSTLITHYAVDLSNWQTVTKLIQFYPQFTQQQFRVLFNKPDNNVGLSRCHRVMGNQTYINLPLFGLWLSGQLPEQQQNKLVKAFLNQGFDKCDFKLQFLMRLLMYLPKISHVIWLVWENL